LFNRSSWENYKTLLTVRCHFMVPTRCVLHRTDQRVFQRRFVSVRGAARHAGQTLRIAHATYYRLRTEPQHRIHRRRVTSFDDHSPAYGNIPDHRRHRLTVSGKWMLPGYRGTSRFRRCLQNSWTVSAVSQTQSAPPLDTVMMGLDLDGDGISQTFLPGTNRHNTVGRGLSASGLRRLVDQYNAKVEANTRRVTNSDGSVMVIRPRTPFNQIVNPIVLPDAFSNGDIFGEAVREFREALAAKLCQSVDALP